MRSWLSGARMLQRRGSCAWLSATQWRSTATSVYTDFSQWMHAASYMYVCLCTSFNHVDKIQDLCYVVYSITHTYKKYMEYVCIYVSYPHGNGQFRFSCIPSNFAFIRMHACMHKRIDITSARCIHTDMHATTVSMHV
jgi:hypothetical protein